MKRIYSIFLFSSLAFHLSVVNAQERMDNATRSLFILDIAKYIEYDDEIQLHADFKIGVLGRNTDFYWELYEMAKTRKFIQEKPIKVLMYPELDNIEKCHVLYVNSGQGFKMKEVLDKTRGNNTLVISEGYAFNESMLNFVVADGTPRFELHEEKLNSEGLKVGELFREQAIKTREDWESLFIETEIALEQEKEIVLEQKVVIDSQKIEIARQSAMIREQLERLDSLNRAIRDKENTIEQKTMVLDRQIREIGLQNEEIIRQRQDVESQRSILGEQKGKIDQQESRIEQQSIRISEQQTILIERLKAIEKQKMLIWFFVIALILVTGLGYFIFRGYRIKKKANIQLEAKNRLIMQQKDEIQQQKEIAESQRDQIAYQKKHITDSIHYALRIQTALLPSLELFSEKLDHFVLYKPRDIVSGDFYWVADIDSRIMIISADCTGHGVPGAFMSMLGVSFLNEIILNRGIIQPDQVINSLREEVIQALKQQDTSSEIKDGLDISVCLLDPDKRTLQFAGALCPLWIISGGELTEIKGDKMPVSIHETMAPFTNHWIDLKQGDTFYIFSDGFADQFGGLNQKKYLSKNFKKKLGEIQAKPMFEQGAELDRVFEEWRKDIEQIDDVTVIGVRV